jgi:hypothetical protein
MKWGIPEREVSSEQSQPKNDLANAIMTIIIATSTAWSASSTAEGLLRAGYRKLLQADSL